MVGMISVAIFCGLIALGFHFLVKNAIEREESAKKKPEILG